MQKAKHIRLPADRILTAIIALSSPIFLKAYIMGIIQEGAESVKSIF